MPNKIRTAAPFAPAAPLKGRVADALSEVSRPDGSFFTQASTAAGKIATQFGEIADAAAKSEGKAAGAVAGLDPNYRPTKMPTLRGEAYDKAATETYANLLDTHLRDDMQKAIDLSGDDPAKLKTAFDGLRTEYLSEHVFDEVTPAFEKTFLKLRLPAERAAQLAQATAVAEAAKASFEKNASAQQSMITKSAVHVGIDKHADAAVAGQLSDYADLLASGAAAGHIEAPVALAMQKDTAEAAARAAVTGMFNRLPDRDAQEIFVSAFDQETRGIAGYEGIGGDVMPRLRNDMVKRLGTSTAAAAELDANADGARVAQIEDHGTQLLKAGQLTTDWADANADTLGVRAEDYRNAASNAPAQSQPFVYAGLIGQSLADPAGAVRDAVAAVGDGALSQSGFAEVHDMAQRVAGDQQTRPWLNDVRRNLAARTAPAPDQDDDHAAIQAQAVPSFEGWLEQNPTASRAEAAAQADALAAQVVASAAASARQTLPLPRFAITARNEITPAALPAIAQRLQLAHDQSQIDDDTLIAQADLLDRWKAALERHSGRGK